MNKFYIYLIILFMTIPTSYAQSKKAISKAQQEYYEYVIKGNYCQATDNYSEALDNYKLAFKKAYPFPDDVKLAIRCAKKRGNKDETILLEKLLKKVSAKPFIIPFIYKENYKDEDFFGLEDVNGGLVISKELTEKTKELAEVTDFPVSQINFDSISSQYSLTNADLMLLPFCLIERFIIRARMINRDVQNSCWAQEIHFLLQLHESKINIDREQSSIWSADCFMNTLNHMAQTSIDVGLDEKFFAFLKDMVNKGNLHPMQCTRLLDVGNRRETSTYGGAYKTRDIDKNSVRAVKELENPDNIDVLRDSMYLPPLWVEAKLYKIELPTNYKFIDNK